jgi:hypothetical protein
MHAAARLLESSKPFVQIIFSLMSAICFSMAAFAYLASASGFTLALALFPLFRPRFACLPCIQLLIQIVNLGLKLGFAFCPRPLVLLQLSNVCRIVATYLILFVSNIHSCDAKRRLMSILVSTGVTHLVDF